MTSYDPEMLALLEAIAAQAAARQAQAAPGPVVQRQGSPFLQWDVPNLAMGHGLYGF